MTSAHRAAAFLISLLLVVGVLALARSASAAPPRTVQCSTETSGDGSLGGGRVESRVGESESCPEPDTGGGGGGGGDGDGDGDGDGVSPTRTETVPHEVNNGEDMPQTRTCPGGGAVQVDQVVDNTTGQVIDEGGPVCANDGPAGEDVPPPPTLQEVLNSAEIPSPTIMANPSTEGITGMESWFWLDNPQTTLSVEAELDGYQVTTTAEAVEWRWTFGDEGSDTATSPGSEAEPAARHTFETKGTHTITVEMVWQGSYTYVGFGVNETVDGLEATTDGSIDYVVTEVVGVITEPDDD